MPLPTRKNFPAPRRARLRGPLAITEFQEAKTVVHSIDAEADQKIGLGDYDLLVGDEVLRLKHIAGDPEWLILSSNASAILV